jgi:catechol 2,3-dioxygenase-like lactoylglutathione lyase family enzyme/GNAT superfamily N-acetyltransferase
LSPIPRLSQAQLRYLTEVDHHDHEALIALAADEPGEPGLGVARYIRLPRRPGSAEAAVTVIDEYQGRGLGTLLLLLLARAAITRGIRRFVAYVLEENRPMREILEGLGAEVHHDSPGLLRMEVDLPERQEDVPDTAAADILRAVAAGLLPEVSPPPLREAVAEGGPELDSRPMGSVVDGLDHVYNWTTDMDRAVAFYRDVLGLELVRRDGGNWALFDAGGRPFALHGAVEGHPVGTGGATAVFRVPDLDAAMRTLEERGVTFSPHVGEVQGYARFSSFTDPDGNTVQLIEYVTGG